MPLFQKRTPVREVVALRDVPVTGNGHDPQPRGREAYYELKTRIHRQLIERLDLAKIDLLPLESVQQQIRRIVEDMLVADDTPLSRQERERAEAEGLVLARAANAGPHRLGHPRERSEDRLR